MKPSIGRIVVARVDPRQNNGASEAPAVITRVWEKHPDGGWVVNLRVLLDTFTMPLSLTSVRLLDVEPDEAESHVAWWPPRV